MVTPLVPFMATLLTMRDGQGEVSMGAALRVIILSGAAEGQEVPQGAKTVERDCALAPTAARATAARKNFMVLTGIVEGEQLGDSVGRKSVGLNRENERLTWCYSDCLEQQNEWEEKREKGKAMQVHGEKLTVLQERLGIGMKTANWAGFGPRAA